MFTVPQRLGVKIEILKRMIEQYDFDLRVCSPGIIETFDPITMTAKITLALKEAIQLDGVPDTKQIPLLVDVPVICIGGGDWVITTPIKHGDECIVFFGDTCIDPWWQSGCVEPFGTGFVANEPMSLRRHSLSDGFALVGPFSQAFVIEEYSPDSLQIRNKDNTICISLTDNKINITGAVDFKEGVVTIQAGASGSFTSMTGQVVTVQKGIVIGIE